MSEAVFRRRADTGDLLLFSGKRIACKIQRFITQSRFGIFSVKLMKIDHVAMLLRYENGKLYILEATNGEGVGIFEWNDANMKDYQDSYERVVYRHLKFKRTSGIICHLQKFLNVFWQYVIFDIESKRKKI